MQRLHRGTICNPSSPYICCKHSKPRCVICSDSLSSIQAINQLYSSNPLIQQIQQLINQFNQTFGNIVIIYVPSHVGIPGNEIADIAARQAAADEELPFSHIYTHSDLSNHLKKRVKLQWEQHWNRSQSKLKHIKPTANNVLFLPLTRRDQVKISRLRLGHTNITHSHLFSREEQITCDTCNKDLTSTHLLVECLKYQEARRHFHVAAEIGEALGNDIEQLNNTLKFLKETKLYYQI